MRTGLAKGVYDEKTSAKLLNVDILKPLLLGSQTPDLLMIDTLNSKAVNKWDYTVKPVKVLQNCITKMLKN